MAWNTDWQFFWACSWHEGICQIQWVWPYEPPAYERLETACVSGPMWAWHLASALGGRDWKGRREGGRYHDSHIEEGRDTTYLPSRHCCCFLSLFGRFRCFLYEFVGNLFSSGGLWHLECWATVGGKVRLKMKWGTFDRAPGH